MPLVHYFSISEGKETIEVPDDLMRYIWDSTLWIKSLWPENKVKKGLPYYGYSIIEVSEIIKLKRIIMQWRELFALADDEIQLTGDYLIDEKRYDKILFSKEDLLGLLDKLIQLCTKAEAKHIPILYEGI